MRKAKVIFVSFIIIAAFISCTLSVAVFDDSIPKEKTTTVLFGNLDVNSYNGIPVSGKGWGYTVGLVNIPAGKATFICNCFIYTIISGRNIRIDLKGAQFTYTFEPGKEYSFYAIEKDGKLGVVIFDKIKKAFIGAGDSESIGFIEFK
jgi:hypothetical protein